MIFKEGGVAIFHVKKREKYSLHDDSFFFGGLISLKNMYGLHSLIQS